MPEQLSLTEVESQAVELLPARTVLSLLAVPPHGGSDGSSTPGRGKNIFPGGAFCTIYACNATSGGATSGTGGAPGSP
ncbi:MAG: hypothetical protein ACRDS0_22035 [Pseudonocardiaceae bacterium]